jgi:hypothetical protein
MLKRSGTQMVSRSFFYTGDPEQAFRLFIVEFLIRPIFALFYSTSEAQGQSRPHADLRENTTWDLVADIEKLKLHLGIEEVDGFWWQLGIDSSSCLCGDSPRECQQPCFARVYFFAEKKRSNGSINEVPTRFSRISGRVI